jgi:rod shape-determining protein MreC
MWDVQPRTWQRLRLFLVLVGVAAFVCLLPSRFTAPARVLSNEAVRAIESGAFEAAGNGLATGGTLTEMFLKEDRERALAREVARLRNENAALADEILRLEQSLGSIQKLALKDLPFRAVRAAVVSYDASSVRRSITVEAGSRDGVGRGMAVTAQGALVGVVAEAGPGQCRVLLITDPDSAVPCRLSRTRALCILQGTGGDDCLADWLDRDSMVEPGDVVVTAVLRVDPGSELRIPDGLPAGTVLRVERDKMRPLFLAVDAAPRVNIERLEAVEILVPE